MPLGASRAAYVCARCLRARDAAEVAGRQQRGVSSSELRREERMNKPSEPEQQPSDDALAQKKSISEEEHDEPEQGALSRRLAQLSEEALETGGSGARKAVSEAGFDSELRARLEERIAAASFRNEHRQAISQANLPAGAGKGTRDIAGAAPWMGTEAVEDTALRMLTDVRKPLRVPGGKKVVRAPRKVDTGRQPGKQQGQKIANARDRSSYYSFMKDGSMSEEEREKFRREMKARFEAGARPIPATLQGLASLANERIEDAIARGQFKNVPRGTKIERDYNASSPFIDTTEYLMNKIIQKQEIVPPWIEKQQDLVRAATKFRGRLRNDWRRHAARTIASYGGGLEVQMRRAKEFAAAELIANPPKAKVETLNAVDSEGHLSQITLAGELKATPDSSGLVPEITEGDIKVVETIVDPVGDGPPPPPPEDASTAEVKVTLEQEPQREPIKPAPYPFRDPSWLATEQSYLAHTVNHLNSLTRSYNLIAPDLAKKPYFNLERELDAMYRDVAPQLANEIRERARAPKVRVSMHTAQSGEGVLGAISARDRAKVWDESKTKQYGLKEFWRDLFAKA